MDYSAIIAAQTIRRNQMDPELWELPPPLLIRACIAIFRGCAWVLDRLRQDAPKLMRQMHERAQPHSAG